MLSSFLSGELVISVTENRYGLLIQKREKKGSYIVLYSHELGVQMGSVFLNQNIETGDNWV